jgi:hypothetical protein
MDEQEKFREAVIREEVRESHRGEPANEEDLDDGVPPPPKKKE